MGASVASEWPTRRSLALVWLVSSVGLAALLVRADQALGPLDDPNGARQRPGLLDLGRLPEPAPQVVAGLPARGRRAVVFFERRSGVLRLCQALGDRSLPADVDTAVVVSAGGWTCGSGATVVGDPTGVLARRFGLDVPRDRGPPVGYAVVDAAGQIRYRTLDPHVANGLDEVTTILAATR